jgi:arylamine N-acetyltransferase
MGNENLTAKQIDKYLRILGVKNTAPGIQVLTDIVAAHVMRIPFENISKLYYLKKYNLRNLPDIDRYLDGIEKYNFGGTCYSNNYYLYLLLKSLGYPVKLCGADMREPDVHIVIMIKIDGREYLIDSGNAAPFLKPVPRDIKSDYSIASGNDVYVLKPQDARGRSVMELYRDGELIHKYVAKPEPREIHYFTRAISDSFMPYSTFMNAVLLTRFYENKSEVIHNYSVIKTEDTLYKKFRLKNRQELKDAIDNYFGIPGKISDVAISSIEKFKDVWN